jgi:ATP diphosphatase
VAHAIADKLIRRHPHVFGGKKGMDPRLLHAQWDRIKSEEKARKGESAGTLDGVPRHLPALQRARKISAKAGMAGLDRAGPGEILAAMRKALPALERALMQEDRACIDDEIGRLLFAIAHLGRLAEVDAEDALRRTMNRFLERFGELEHLSPPGGEFNTSTSGLAALWNEITTCGEQLRSDR